MVYDPETLDQVSANYLASYDDTTVAFADVTTGEAFFYRVQNDADREEILSMLRPAELVLPRGFERETEGVLVSRTDASGASWDVLRSYILRLQGEEVANSMPAFEERSLSQSLRVSPTVLRHLEVFETSRGDVKPTLFSAIDRTRTSAGARQLKQWLSIPLA